MNHLIAQAHIPPARLNKPGTVTCECKVTVSAKPDRALEDPWQPLAKAFAAHRLSVGARSGDAKKGRQAWTRMSLTADVA